MHPTKASQHEFLTTCIDVDFGEKHQACTRNRGHQTTYFVPYRGAPRQICKTQFLHYFKISCTVVQSVAKVKAGAAAATPLSPLAAGQAFAIGHRRI